MTDGALQAKDELDKDGVIQRFEFTFEQMWKCLKIFLQDNGIECKSPKECLKSAFRIGLLVNEEGFLDMLEDRNLTTHLYNKEKSEKIFQKIKDSYLPHMEELLKKLKEGD